VPATVIEALMEAGLYDRFRPVIRETLLGYHVRDVRGNIPQLYQQWLKMPDVASDALKFGARPFVPGSPPSLQTFLARIMEREEGTNTLQGIVSRFNNHEVDECGMKMSLIRFYLQNSNRQDSLPIRHELREATQQLAEIYQEIRRELPKIESSDATPQNIALLNRVEEIRSFLASPMSELITKATLLLTPEERELLAGRQFSLSAPLIVPFRVPSQDLPVLDKFELESLRAAGYGGV
jgi:hypothetical protein